MDPEIRFILQKDHDCNIILEGEVVGSIKGWRTVEDARWMGEIVWTKYLPCLAQLAIIRAFMSLDNTIDFV